MFYRCFIFYPLLKDTTFAHTKTPVGEGEIENHQPTEAYSQIPNTIHMIIIAGNEDTSADVDSDLIWNSCPQIHPDQKDWIFIKSARSGDPEVNDLIAGHYAFLGSTNYEVNALEYYGYWKCATAMLNSSAMKLLSNKGSC